MAISAAIGTPLETCLAQAVESDPALKDAAAVIAAVARSAVEISERIGRGALGGDLAAAGEHNSDGDVQKALDVIAHESVTAALRGAPVAEVASEEAEEVMRLNPDAPLAVAIDPLDGSSNIGVNMAVGMIFGIRPSIKDPAQPARLVHDARLGADRRRLRDLRPGHRADPDARARAPNPTCWTGPRARSA